MKRLFSVKVFHILTKAVPGIKMMKALTAMNGIIDELGGVLCDE
ncbi:hypothetical protein SPACI_044170 [Sporomusa acidovorans DSM 3132]|uniref:Uncharacterized protein n=1 Tax=Sporomusa acidovorans (strain ATCC 49682 / DSM 3132 / Mol) TaxID=1123286 RepID=A0ABZ3J8S0_SPOA4|nr:hypothetical protein SPACI_21060 [Sporomusa acidovorans DSM 3132]SDE66031.1 hypothetical protein SAMN04488499_101871 [Sporomusa acidovorans]